MITNAHGSHSVILIHHHLFVATATLIHGSPLAVSISSVLHSLKAIHEFDSCSIDFIFLTAPSQPLGL